MLIIRSAEALARLAATHPDATLRHLLTVQAEHLAEYDLEDVALLLVVQPHDTLEALNEALGWPLLTAGQFTHLAELLVQQPGWYEVTFILSDDGFGVVLLVPDDADPLLLAACEREKTR